MNTIPALSLSLLVATACGRAQHAHGHHAPHASKADAPFVADHVEKQATITLHGELDTVWPLFDPIHEMVTHPQTVLGLSDGGAHCGLICDASAPTYLLSHWVRDRSRGPRVGLEWAVHAQTRLREEQLLFEQTRHTDTRPVVLRLGMVYGRGILM